MKKLFAIILAGLFLPVFCFGDVVYDRTPTGTDILSPITVDVSFDDWETDVNCAIGEVWSVVVQATDDGEFGNGEWYASTTKEAIFVITLPIDDYYFVGFVCDYNYGQNGNADLLEGTYNPEIILFSITGQTPPPPPEYYILPVKLTATTTIPNILAYAGQLFDDLSPFIITILGLFVGFYVLNKSISLATKKFKK